MVVTVGKYLSRRDVETDRAPMQINLAAYIIIIRHQTVHTAVDPVSVPLQYCTVFDTVSVTR
jgi:hypothetical protein